MGIGVGGADVVPPLKRTKPTLDHSIGILRVVRELPPANCILEIESFSLLQVALSASSKDHYESTEFSAGGYRWMLSVYPKGNKDENGDGYLSLYITLVTKLDLTSSVHATLKFFIYDQIQDNYLAILDLREKRFRAMKTKWGIPKALSLNVFTDASNGFLVNDCCVLGAEVSVINGEKSTSKVSMVKAPCDWIYTWKIEKLSEFVDSVYSPVFTFQGWSWKLQLWPRGYGEQEGKSLSLFLHLDNSENLSNGSKLYANFSLCIKKHRTDSEYGRFTGNWFTRSVRSWGYNPFIPLSDLNDPTKGLIVNDAITIGVNMKGMFLLEAKT